ncbi:MAG: diaminopimelate decarboxylase [Bdellovibrionales bacterium]|nr:diaminopimelate decarboxylase [Bdellovibrionales bacterium]
MFLYKNNRLVLQKEDSFVPVEEIAQQQKKPFYLYDLEGIKKWYRFFISQTKQSLKVFFAMKSNNNKQILTALKEEGCGVDVVSLGEAQLALNLGFSPQKIVFSGVGKTTEELNLAVTQSFFQTNIESFEELHRLIQIVKQRKKNIKIGLRINPNIDFKSHPYIKTGLNEHKFGLDESELKNILNCIKQHKQISLKGLSMHIGSQIYDIQALSKAMSSLKMLYKSIKKQGFPLEVLDIGGGLGIKYEKEDLEDEKNRLFAFNQAFKDVFKNFEAEIITEPGRFLVARFGILCSQVEYLKQNPQKQFLILNSGMNHFLRTALYGTQHRILPLLQRQGEKELYDVVGPICETGDTFYKDCLLSPRKPGDWLAIADTGAYGFVMSNSYNLQIPIKEVCIS